VRYTSPFQKSEIPVLWRELARRHLTLLDYNLVLQFL
jgi:hypothetical protein